MPDKTLIPGEVDRVTLEPRGTPGCKNCEAMQTFFEEYDDSPLFGCNCNCESCVVIWARNDRLRAACSYTAVGWRSPPLEVGALLKSPQYYFLFPYGELVKCKPCSEKFK